MEPTQQPLAFDTQGNLIINGVHSANYVAGSAGWSINRDGSAEYNNIVIRNGTVVSGLALYYSGPPALGNLIESVSATAGVDAFGNTYLAGVVSYNNGGSVVQLHGGQINFGDTPGGVPTLANGSRIIDTAFGGGLTIQSGKTAVKPSRAQTVMNAGVSTAPLPNYSGNPTMSIADSLRLSAIIVDVMGAMEWNNAAGGTPGWITPAFAAGWANNSLMVRVDVEDNIVWVGQFHYTGANITAAGGQVITTAVDAEHRPAASWRIPMAHLTSTSVVKNVDSVVTINSTGTLSVFWGDGMTGTVHDVDGLATGDLFSFNAVIPRGNLI